MIAPGSTHDALIWRGSMARTIMERQSQFFIAGDSAYRISREGSLFNVVVNDPFLHHNVVNAMINIVGLVSSHPF